MTSPSKQLNLFEVDFSKKDTMYKQFLDFPQDDEMWTEEHWRGFINILVENNIVNYKEVAALLLGHLNPPQVGTSIASKKTFQNNYPPRQIWRAVRKWNFSQIGKCVDCGTRLELHADHIVSPKDIGIEAADRLENMTLRCRRCNVIKRPTHKNGGKTFLTTESALMWILLFKRPTTYQEYAQMCREYGLTMSDIRIMESWAMAKWLEKEGLFTINDMVSTY